MEAIQCCNHALFNIYYLIYVFRQITVETATVENDEGHPVVVKVPVSIIFLIFFKVAWTKTEATYF